jgi:DeoR/GlpR family transcriptional regulator of sugar metabolism
MIARARRTIVLAGEAKLGTAGPYVIAPAERVSVLVTDASEERCAPFREAGIEVLS